MEILTYWILQAIIYLLPGICYCCYYYYAKQEQDHKSKPSPQRQPKYSNTYLTNPRNRQLQAQLLEMLQGNVSTAKQLLLQQRQWFPGRHDNWYLAKVIYNLEHGIDELRDCEMYSQLLVMLQGDATSAERLLLHASNAYPGKQYGWYLEKVISDLERDRR
ncbi:MAG: hypothetical protein RMZ42_31355 [Nostoc sp. DedQUE05]|uniref:hypothetical protein n=1 Tax=Nostoc sp. DedQUE05 TaxID=3075391 RepID=UPI002AD2D661|nr:hypothetical protein [Nostoc sp. DedQUE05]MDZ8096400.1 hypothetical protein [Nostoc sp. DedQUE05]